MIDRVIDYLIVGGISFTSIMFIIYLLDYVMFPVTKPIASTIKGGQLE